MTREFLAAENDLSTDELFARVFDGLGDEDDDTPRGSLIALHGRPTRAVVERCVALCGASDALSRTVGVRVLRELKHQTVDSRLLWPPIEPTVIRLVTNEEDPEVLRWAVSCLGYQASSSAAVAAVLTRVDHEDWRVRFHVAAALPLMLRAENSSPAAVAALVRLADDVDADVRAYALMGLADDLGLSETAEIRPVLERHRSDPDEQIREYVRGALADTGNSQLER